MSTQVRRIDVSCLAELLDEVVLRALRAWLSYRFYFFHVVVQQLTRWDNSLDEAIAWGTGSASNKVYEQMCPRTDLSSCSSAL